MNQGEGSPTSPVSTGRQSTVAISRAVGSAYERPERARTSQACEPCRERKTKCDGERPSCRRCLHTGTPCHYGYGKGWRKRKTAEDLSLTSSRLERYEDLLADILPMVSSQVKVMIEDARNSENIGPHSPVSDSTDNQNDRQSSGSQPSDRSRLPPLPLPVPSPLMPHSARVSSHTTFDPITSSSNSSGSANHIGPRHSLKRSLDDTAALNRLPSIRPDGILIGAQSRTDGPLRAFYIHTSGETSLSNVRAERPEESLSDVSKHNSAST